jgi:hypothetical protein
LRAGEHKEFPFHFIAPNGPVTYHGHLLNVDWYLTARARRSPYGFFKSEEDFLLQAGDPIGAVMLGATKILDKDLPAHSIEQQPPSNNFLEVRAGSPEPPRVWSKAVDTLFGLSIVLFMAIVSGLMEEFLGWPAVLATVISIVTVILLVAALFENAYKRKLKFGDVWVKPAMVYGGSAVYCHVDFIAKRQFHLRNIEASISIRERITRTAGTNTETETHILDEKTYTRPFNEDLLEGRWIAFDCALPVGSDEPATFSSSNNALEWTVTMKADLKGWPAWQKSFPITVLPCAFADQQDDRKLFVVA